MLKSIMRDLALTVLLNLDICECCAWFDFDPGHDGFAVFGIWDPNNLDVADRRMRVPGKFFDFARINIFAAANNHDP